ncbi:hypothetical protein KAI78_00530 [bacterium]|nr:hypothetical protein [bacterium]
MKKGFVLLLALVVSLAVFAADSGYDGDYNGYDGDYTGYYYEDQNGSSSNDSVSRNESVFNYLSGSSVSHENYTLEVTLSVAIPAGTAKVVLYKRYDWASYETTDWCAFKTCYAGFCASISNTVETLDEVAEYGDAIEFRAAFFNYRGKLIGISNIMRKAWTPIL